jgi:Holliday junction resolvasome RuvABC endonuclease subunit
MKCYGGIDPGMSGGLALIDNNGDVLSLVKMPETELDVYQLLQAWKGQLVVAQSINVLLEQVHAMPKQGVSSTFKFGMGYGALRMGLVAAGLSFETVTSRKWQGALGCLTGGNKNVSKGRAQQLFPEVKKVTHALADALLIAEYARRRGEGMLRG